jgi:hypothetical protein
MVLRAEPGKQRPRSCRTQELARSSAQEKERRKKAGLLDSGRIARGFGAWEPSQSRARAEVACSLKGRSERTLGQMNARYRCE